MKNYFEFYGIEERFFIDELKLKQDYLRISKENHPDFFIADEQQYLKAVDISSTNNAAYKTLKSLEARVLYILKQHNLLDEQSSSLSPAFLMEMMEVNEEIMDLKINFEPRKLEVVTTKVSALDSECSEELQNAAARADHTTDIDDKYAIVQQVREFYLKRKYVLRLKESLNTFATI